jgi:hypothetical protein
MHHGGICGIYFTTSFIWAIQMGTLGTGGLFHIRLVIPVHFAIDASLLFVISEFLSAAGVDASLIFGV